MDLSREPLVKAFVLALVAVLVANKVIDDAAAQAWTNLAISAVALWYARSKAMPVETVKKAGQDPALLVERAKAAR